MEYEDNVAYLARWMERIGLADRWIFRPPGSLDRVVGADDRGARSGSTRMRLRPSTSAAHRRFETSTARSAGSSTWRRIRSRCRSVLRSATTTTIAVLDAYDYHFTYGENLGSADCAVPVGTLRLAADPAAGRARLVGFDGRRFPPGAVTTVANWAHTGKDVEWDGQTWHWSKDREFVKFAELARTRLRGRSRSRSGRVAGSRTRCSSGTVGESCRRSPIPTNIAPTSSGLAASSRPRRSSTSHRAAAGSATAAPRTSLQDGPWSPRTRDSAKFVPAGEGLFAFSTLDEAAAASECDRDAITRAIRRRRARSRASTSTPSACCGGFCERWGCCERQAADHRQRPDGAVPAGRRHLVLPRITSWGLPASATTSGTSRIPASGRTTRPRTGLVEGCDCNVDYLRAVMARFGLDEQAGPTAFPGSRSGSGSPTRSARRLSHTADLAGQCLRYARAPRRVPRRARLVYIDTDPGLHAGQARTRPGRFPQARGRARRAVHVRRAGLAGTCPTPAIAGSGRARRSCSPSGARARRTARSTRR